MASISTTAEGFRIVQFVAPDGKRKSARLGKVPMKTAKEVRRRVEYLVAAVGSGTAPDTDTVKSLAAIGSELQERLAAAGLVAHRTTASQTCPSRTVLINTGLLLMSRPATHSQATTAASSADSV
jgi:hypothetical protein